MTWHDTSLSGIGTHLLDHTISITLGDVEELRGTCSLIVGAGSIDHVAEVIKLMTGMLLSLPAVLGSPLMGMFRIDGAGRIEVAVRLLGSSHDVKHAVDIGLQLLIGIGLEYIGCSLDGLIDISIVEREAHELSHIPLRCLESGMSRVLQRVGSHLEVLVTVLALAFREGEGNRHLSGCLDAVAPEGVRRNFY